jgi:putative ABC transport system substrate-binding protein
MRRRDAIAATAGAAVAWPLRGGSQERGRLPRLGLLSPFSRSDTAQWHKAFRQGLRDLGWIEGTSVAIDYRYGDGRTERLDALVAELLVLPVDIIVVAVTPDALAARNATTQVPIVMASAGDPVAAGLVASLARPGGNVTGLSQMAADLVGKRLELLRAVAPRIDRVAVLWNPRDKISTLSWQEIQRPARQLGVALQSLEVRGPDDFDPAFAAAVGADADAVIALPAPLFVANEQRIAEFAASRRLPSAFHLPEFVRFGGLLSYGPDRSDLFRRAATYVDQILKGAKPGELPIQQPTKFELVVNLKTAGLLGLPIPESILAAADEVIE